jgi:hypothetical protein
MIINIIGAVGIVGMGIVAISLLWRLARDEKRLWVLAGDDDEDVAEPMSAAEIECKAELRETWERFHLVDATEN